MENVPARRGATIVNDKTGERIRFKTGPDHVCNFEFRVSPRGGVFVPHLHLHQSERIVLLEGELTVVVNGVPRRLRAGESLVLPPTTRHTLDNTGTIEAVADVTFTPAGRTELFLRNIFGLARDGRTKANGDISLLQAAIMLPYCDIYRADIPLFVQKALFAILRPFARLAGYRARYAQYDPEAPAS